MRAENRAPTRSDLMASWTREGHVLPIEKNTNRRFAALAPSRPNVLPMVALLCLPGTTYAQQPPASVEQDVATDLEAVSVHARRHDARRDDTASRLVFDAETLGRYGDTALTDALRRLPGITVETGAPGRAGALSLRGMGAGYTQVLVNGQRQPAGFDIDSLSPDTIDRVEILRSTTADQRAEAIAGTINIVLAGTRRKDSDRLSLASGTSSGNRQIYSMTWEHSRHQTWGSYSWIAAASRREFLVEEAGSEQTFGIGGQELITRENRLRASGNRDVASFTPTVELHLGDDDTLRLQGSAEVSRFGRGTDIEWRTPLGLELSHTDYRQDTDIEVALVRGTADWKRELTGGGRFNARFSAEGNRERSLFTERGRNASGERSVEERTDAELSVHGFQTSGSHILPDLGRHAMKWGWDASLDRRREERDQAISYFGMAEDVSSAMIFDARLQRVAFYLQDEVSIGSRWSVYLGARWEHIATLSEGSDFATIRNRNQVASPVVQSLWKLSDDGETRLRLALNRTFKAPTLAKLIPRPYTSTNNRPTDPDEVGNPMLRPELATGLDVAYETASQGRHFNIGGYLRKIEDVVATSLSQRGERWVSTPANGGDALAWGVEIDGGMPLAEIWPSAPEIDLRLNATRAWSRVEDVPGPDNLIPEQTRFSANLGADYRINQARSAGASYAYRSGSAIRTNAYQLQLQSARHELDLYALWSLSSSTRLRWSISNLLRQSLRSGQNFSSEDVDTETRRTREGTALFRVQVEVQL